MTCPSDALQLLHKQKIECATHHMVEVARENSADQHIGEQVLVVAGAPSSKGRPRFDGRSGRAYTPSATRAAEETFAARVAAQWQGREPFDGALAVDLDFELAVPASFPRWRAVAALAGEVHPVTRPDLDNYEKLTLDACNGLLWVDDAQIVQVSKRKRYGALPRTIIKVRRLLHLERRPGR